MPMLMMALAVWAALPGGRTQPLPPPADGDIRVVYFELRNQTEIFLTIVPRAGGDAPTPGLSLTFSRVSSGRAPQPPASSSTVIDVRAYAGTTWAPRPQLSFDIDGEHVDVAEPSDALNTGGAVPDYLAVFKTVRLLERIGAGDHVGGNALGFRFELTDAQRKAFRDFVARLQSRDQERGK